MRLPWRKNNWPRKIVKLADGRAITIAELAIDAPQEALSALDDFENMFARVNTATGTITTQNVMATATKAVEALRTNNEHCGVEFDAAGCRFTLVDVLTLVDAAYGKNQALGKAPAPSSAAAEGCAPLSMCAN